MMGKFDYKGYYQKLFSVPIKLHDVYEEPNTGSTYALISTGNGWFVVYPGNDAGEYGHDESGARKEWKRIKG